MSDWKEYTLGDISRNISRRFDFNAYPNVVFINTGDVLNNKFLHCDISNIKDLPGQAKKAIKKGDILYSEIRPGNGRYLFVDNDLDNYVVSTKFMVIEPNANIVLPEFLFLLLISNETTEYFKMIAESRSGTFPQITFDSVSSLSLNIPDKETQQKILDIITPLDDKIELNTQINQTLEQTAQALFKSWFVDFDPVRAKVQALSDGLSLEQAELAAMQAISGKTPEELTALSQTQPERYAELAETAKAFPCEMVEVDEVEVPKGWRIGSFTDITESRREKVKNDKATVLSAVSSGELVKSEEYFTKQVFSKSIDKYLKVYKWDFAYNPARINIGSIGLHEADYLGAVSPVYEVFSVPDKYHWFLKRILNLETTKIKIQSLCTGSVRQTLKLKDFQSIDCVIPDEKTLSIFNKKWEEYRTLILENNKNTQTLSEIRDLLLPRLLSGKIEND